MSVSSANTLISPTNATTALNRDRSTSAGGARRVKVVAANEGTGGGGGGGGSGSTVTTGPATSPQQQATSPAATTSSTHSRRSTHGRTHSVGHGHGHGHHGHVTHGHGHGHGHHMVRRNTHGHGHGHGHGHASGTHSSHGHSRTTRRSSEGESGRRALAAGLTMQALDAAVTAAAAAQGERSSHYPGKIKRKTSDHGHYGHHGAHHRHGHAHVVHHAHPKTSRSESNLMKLSRTPSSSTMSALTSESGSTAHSRKRREHKDEEIVQVIEGDGEGEDVEEAEDEEWESGEETPAPGSRRHRSVSDPVKQAALRRVSGASAAASTASQQQQDAKGGGSPLDLGAPTPGVEPPVTQRTTGFPAAVTTPGSVSTPASASDAAPGAATPPSDSMRSTSATSQVIATESDSSDVRPAEPPISAQSQGGPAVDNTAEGSAFPFPRIPKEETRETYTDDHAVVQSPTSIKQQQKAPKASAPAPIRGRVDSLPAVPAMAESAPQHAPVMTKQASHTSLRSLRAPHPLNSPSDPRGPGHGSPTSKRVASLHYPPAAPAVVYRETVGGQGWDETGSAGATSAPASATAASATSAAGQTPDKPPGRTERMGSFSSVRSLKDLLAQSGIATPSRNQTFAGSAPSSRHPSRRLTAMQAASAASRLNTTSDPVAYHQSLGFSPATAETAHLLSRFLPAKKQRRPRWVITLREAQLAGEAAERGEMHDYRVGLTDGQYREAHESLVQTLKQMPRSTMPRRGPRSYYNILSPEEQPIEPAQGQTPFEASVARCLVQRPKLVM